MRRSPSHFFFLIFLALSCCWAYAVYWLLLLYVNSYLVIKKMKIKRETYHRSSELSHFILFFHYEWWEKPEISLIYWNQNIITKSCSVSLNLTCQIESHLFCIECTQWYRLSNQAQIFLSEKSDMWQCIVYIADTHTTFIWYILHCMYRYQICFVRSFNFKPMAVFFYEVSRTDDNLNTYTHVANTVASIKSR